MAAQRADDHGHTVLHLQRIRARGAEDRAAERQDSPYVVGPELVDDAALQAAGPAVLHAADRVAELKRAPRHRPDRGVESGRVSTTGEDPYSHAHRLIAPRTPRLRLEFAGTPGTASASGPIAPGAGAASPQRA